MTLAHDRTHDLVHDRTSDFLEGGRRERRQIITPEGVPLSVELADHGERLVAFAIDLFVWLVLIIVLMTALVSAFGISGGSLIAVSIGLFLAFVMRNLYFVAFELAWRGATPGKRLLGLRVIDRAGGPLLPSAIVARNLTREIETFLPLGVLLTTQKGAGGAVDWSNLGIACWMLFFAALPFINRDRMRGGDFLAGTLVISLPKRVLLGDLVEQKARFSFTSAQLKAYGAFELQVLEELLRRPVTPDSVRLLTEVCDKICRRINWPTPLAPADVGPFLREFYTAERAFLEHEQLFGKARADKHAKPSE
jgi:uncharacterized RDD family membrane protein YckC